MTQASDKTLSNIYKLNSQQTGIVRTSTLPYIVVVVPYIE